MTHDELKTMASEYFDDVQQSVRYLSQYFDDDQQPNNEYLLHIMQSNMEDCNAEATEDILSTIYTVFLNKDRLIDKLIPANSEDNIIQAYDFKAEVDKIVSELPMPEDVDILYKYLCSQNTKVIETIIRYRGCSIAEAIFRWRKTVIESIATSLKNKLSDLLYDQISKNTQQQ